MKISVHSGSGQDGERGKRIGVDGKKSWHGDEQTCMHTHTNDVLVRGEDEEVKTHWYISLLGGVES